jgi:hypothetical protein
MSQQIEVARVLQFKANVLNLYQQMGSKLKGKVREESVTGKAHFFERLGATAAVKRTTRHADTPQVDTPHTRRMVTMVDYEWADLVDDQDKIRLLIDPASEYARNAAMALGRAYDDEVIAAFGAAAKGGEDGSTSVAFTDEDAGDVDYSAAALTLANLLAVKKLLDDQDVPDDGRYILMPPSGFEQLLKQSTAPNVSSTDYNSVHALVKGDINSLLGFEFIRSTRLPLAAATEPYCFAWHRDSMGIAIGKDITTRISERDDKSYATQVYASMTMGATRIQGNGVVRFQIDNDN